MIVPSDLFVGLALRPLEMAPGHLCRGVCWLIERPAGAVVEGLTPYASVVLI